MAILIHHRYYLTTLSEYCINVSSIITLYELFWTLRGCILSLVILEKFCKLQYRTGATGGPKLPQRVNVQTFLQLGEELGLGNRESFHPIPIVSIGYEEKKDKNHQTST